MSDRMRPMAFSQLLDWALTEYETEGRIFSCEKIYAPKSRGRFVFGREKIDLPVGPAAGPHTQMAQNLVSAYLAGARLFELKTVQFLDGEDLTVHKPCILAEDEGYNCEWSTELTVGQAYEEYVKAYFLIIVLGKELGLGGREGFSFNMSVGYDLAGIQSEKVDGFIEGLKCAKGRPIFESCREELLKRASSFKHLTREEIESISPVICKSVTMSTMHGCPAQEIERIAAYLIKDKGLDLFLKCNPTLVGCEKAGEALKKCGFDYVHFQRESFDHDLQLSDALPMIGRLRDLARERGQFFGLKLTNTFPVDVLHAELPDPVMYMSGRSLLPLSLGVAAQMAGAFGSDLQISYCGGVTAKNICEILQTGISSVSICTDLLRPAGFSARLAASAEAADSLSEIPKELSEEAIRSLSESLCAPARGGGVKRRPRPEEPQMSLHCKKVCQTCVRVCPNRANKVIDLGGEKVLLHLDGLCNECGNCASFCPDSGLAPYLERLTLFADEASLLESKNSGFAPLDAAHERFILRSGGEVKRLQLCQEEGTDDEIPAVIRAVKERYSYLFYL